MMKFNIFLILIVLLHPFTSRSQNDGALEESDEGYILITLEEAIFHALEHNHQIRVSRLTSDVAERNVYIGNAGLLPQVFIEGGFSPAIQAVEMEFFDPGVPAIRETGAISRLTNGAAGINYILFDGFNRYYTMERLRSESRAAGAQTRLEIENTLINVINTYLEVAQLEQEFRISQKMLELSQQRLQRARTAYEFGGQTRLEVLNAEVDLNTDSVTLLRTELNLNNSKRNLKVLMGQRPDINIIVSTEIELNTSLEADKILDRALSRNSRLNLAQQNSRISDIDVQLSRAGMFPRLDLNVQYTINRQFNEAGFFRFQDIRSFTGGINLRYNIFDGRRRVAQTQIAELNRNSQLEQLEQIRKEVERDVLNAYANYRNSLYLLQLERRNQETVQLNFERTVDAFALGQVSTTQYREAQINLSQAELRLVQLQYQVKMSEIELYRLAGLLIPEN